MGPQQTASPKETQEERKEKLMPTVSVRRKTKMIRNRCALRRSTTTLLASKRRLTSSTFKKECNGCCPDQSSGRRVSPGTQGSGQKCSHDALQEGMMPPRGGTTFVSDEPTRIYPEKPYPHPKRTVAQYPAMSRPRHHQTSHPPTCATTVTKPQSSSPRSNRHVVCKTEASRRLYR